MSGFFSLSGKDQEQEDHRAAETNYNLFLLNKNEEIYNNNKGFELWQQQYQFHQQRSLQQSHPPPPPPHTQDVNFSIGPSSRGRRSNDIADGSTGDELGFRVMMSHQGRGSGSDGINCQDCGNQAKKDCQHMRCRTCCKSRGLPCQTHVKSTWVPAARRRERLQQMASLQQDQQQQLTVRGENTKRLRERGGGNGGGFELGNFPAEVNSPATFRCVRVSAIDDAEEHFAYQTAVNIGGHVFKGILYDQGPEGRYPGGGAGAGEGPSGSGGGSQQQPLDLIAAAASTPAAITGGMNVSMYDPSIYPPHQLGGYMAGTQFFLPPKP